jgi:hypothetical protein
LSSDSKAQQTIGHSLGEAVIKAALGNMQVKKGKSGQAGYKLLEQTVDVFKYARRPLCTCSFRSDGSSTDLS